MIPRARFVGARFVLSVYSDGPGIVGAPRGVKLVWTCKVCDSVGPGTRDVDAWYAEMEAHARTCEGSPPR